MASNLLGRLRRLERETVAARGTRCDECGRLIGWRCGDPPDPAVKYVASFDEPDGPDQCPACGRRRVYRATFK